MVERTLVQLLLREYDKDDVLARCLVELDTALATLTIPTLAPTTDIPNDVVVELGHVSNPAPKASAQDQGIPQPLENNRAPIQDENMSGTASAARPKRVAEMPGDGEHSISPRVATTKTPRTAQGLAASRTHVRVRDLPQTRVGFALPPVGAPNPVARNTAAVHDENKLPATDAPSWAKQAEQSLSSVPASPVPAHLSNQ